MEITGLVTFWGLVVLANPKTVINDQDAPQEVKQVIRADQLVETIADEQGIMN